MTSESKTVEKVTEQVTNILDYETVILAGEMKFYCYHLSRKRHDEILNLLVQYNNLFDVILRAIVASQYILNERNVSLLVSTIPMSSENHF